MYLLKVFGFVKLCEFLDFPEAITLFTTYDSDCQCGRSIIGGGGGGEVILIYIRVHRLKAIDFK